MNCPNCHAECQLHTHKGFAGYSCPNCHKSGTAADLTDKPVTQMSMYQAMAPYHETQLLTATKGAVDVLVCENGGCKKSPKRDMVVGFKDSKINTFIRHAIFSCS